MPIEIEWNPFSTASRAARAERDGRVGEALRLYVRAGQFDRFDRCLAEAVPDPRLHATLREAIRQVIDLRKATLPRQRPAGGPVVEGMLEQLRREGPRIERAVWASADRIAMALAYHADRTGLDDELEVEVKGLARLVTAIQAARQALAEATLRDEVADRENATIGLRALADAAKELSGAP